jgi:hypothetical protein
MVTCECGERAEVRPGPPPLRKRRTTPPQDNSLDFTLSVAGWIAFMLALGGLFSLTYFLEMDWLDGNAAPTLARMQQRQIGLILSGIAVGVGFLGWLIVFALRYNASKRD